MSNLFTAAIPGRHPVRQLIGGLDGHLSRSQGVASFSHDPACILRYAIIPAPHAVRLSDGAEIAAGRPIIDLHCWNERVPTMPIMGPDLAWAQAVARRLRQSLRLLAAEMGRDPVFDAVVGCRAKVNFVGRGCSNVSVSRIIARMGFEDVDEGAASSWGWVHDGFENLLIAALVWTHNPAALRREKMLRQRRPVYASRDRLLALHAPTITASPATSRAPRAPGMAAALANGLALD